MGQEKAQALSLLCLLEQRVLLEGHLRDTVRDSEGRFSFLSGSLLYHPLTPSILVGSHLFDHKPCLGLRPVLSSKIKSEAILVSGSSWTMEEAGRCRVEYSVGA